MIFLDTSVVIAMANDQDPNHVDAIAAFGHALAERERILTHNYVVVETASLLQRRIGRDPALDFLAQSRSFEVHWVSSEEHQDAIDLLADRSRRRLSFVDCASFVVMRRYGVTEALAYDGDFEAEGFTIYRAANGNA